MRRQSTLTLHDAETIRERYAGGGVTQTALAVEYGVSQPLISGIVRLEYLTGKPATCKVCGTVFEPDTPTHAYCSRSCFDEGRRRRYRATYRAKNPIPEGRVCPHCGDPVNRQRDAVYCSDRCMYAARNATRKASWKVGGRQERVSRAYIVARDKSRCHLCGKACRDEEIHLDHLIPLSRGGTHAPENLRVACAKCNLEKGARARGEQLLLVG